MFFSLSFIESLSYVRYDQYQDHEKGDLLQISGSFEVRIIRSLFNYFPFKYFL